uniref:Uncharacterized protein n=1 Tax=Moniliophthora roreri TaxID=221103 RepID=A0A0W0FIH8_MONRR
MVSMAQFLNAVNVMNRVTIHRTAETTSVQSAEDTVLTISLRIAHNFDKVNRFLSWTLPEFIHLLMAMRTTTVMLPLSVTSLTNPISTEVVLNGYSDDADVIFTQLDGIEFVLQAGDQEEITVQTMDGETHTFTSTINNSEEFFLMLGCQTFSLKDFIPFVEKRDKVFAVKSEAVLPTIWCIKTDEQGGKASQIRKASIGLFMFPMLQTTDSMPDTK